jgi:hypothetical protein
MEFETDCVRKRSKKDHTVSTTVGSVLVFSVLLRHASDHSVFGTPLLFSLKIEGLTTAKIVEKVAELVRMNTEGKNNGVKEVYVVSKSGKKCGNCDDPTCRGCAVTDELLKKKILKKNELKLRVNLGVNLPDEEVKFVTQRKVREEEKNEKEKEITLDDCLRAFLQSEVLSESDMWYCGSSCKNFVQAEKQIGIWKLPQVLVVHLKRFAFISNRYREKLTDFVDYPIQNLSMDEYLLPNSPQRGGVSYELFAVSNHMGGLGGGHYTAYAKPNDDFYLFDDQVCTKVDDEERVKTKNSYILYYIRK